MSLFQTETTRCPDCQGTIRFEVVYSLNADRRPDLRDAFLDGSFQRETCAGCGKQMRMQPRFSYVDNARHQWILVEPTSELHNWRELEEVARETFANNYGEGASRIARELGGAIVPRVTFGWAALSEKLLCIEAGIDDVALECTKMLVIRGAEAAPIADDVDLRLVEADAKQLRFAWLRSKDEVVAETLTVPRSIYDGVVKDAEGWAEMQAALQEGWYVDVNRLLVPAVETT
jgi:hypothetical protein